MLTDKLVIGIDYNNLLMASFFSKDLINSRGENVNAIKGFFFKLANIIDTYDPDFLVVSNDIGREATFRRKMYAPYKGTRGPKPEGLGNQLRYGTQLLELMGIPVLNNPNYEADDILGMLSRFAMDNEMNTILVSADKDYYQLVTDHVKVYSPRKGILVDKEWLYNEYGLSPEQLIDVKALAGDKSDNIPGAIGIGEGTALKMMRQYQSLDQVLFHAAVFPPKIRNALDFNKENIALSKTLGTIITDYNIIGMDIDMISRRKDANISDAMALIKQLEVPSIIPIVERIMGTQY